MRSLRKPVPDVALHLLLIAGFSVAAMLPAYFNGVPFGPDQIQHFQFASNIYDSVAAGDIYPQLAPATNHGFGDYGIRFYPPLTYYGLSAARFFFGNWFTGTLIFATILFFLSGLGMYALARNVFPSSQALIAAGLYIFAPYHLNEFYGSFLLAEFTAMAVLPFCLLFLLRICKKTNKSDILGFSVAYGLLILTHLPTLIIGTAAVCLIYLALVTKKTFVSATISLLIAVGLSGSMTSFYWSRMIPELSWINHSSPAYFAGAFDFRSNFLLGFDQLANFPNDERSLWFADIMLIVTLAVMIPTIVFLIKGSISMSRTVGAFLTVCLGSLFLMTPLSSFVWGHFALLHKLQFPWRWLTIFSLSGVVIASIGIDNLSEMLKRSRNALIPIAVGLVLILFVVTAGLIVKGTVYITRSDLDQQVANIPESEGCDCWWPIWASKNAFEQREKAAVGGRSVGVENWGRYEKTFTVGSGSASTASLATFYYPFWKANVNGSEVSVRADEAGRVALDVPEEESTVVVSFHEPRSIRTAGLLSLILWICVLVSIPVLIRRENRPNRSNISVE